MKLYDSHAHYNDEKFDEYRKEIIEKILNENINFIVAGYNLKSSEDAIKISEKYKQIYCTCGTYIKVII